MLLTGALAGVLGEALNRKRILLTQLLVMTATSAVLCTLALLGQVRVWHIILAGAVNGLVWASELAVRRRMIGEVVAPDRVTAAVAFASMTNSIARVLDPALREGRVVARFGPVPGGRRRYGAVAVVWARLHVAGDRRPRHGGVLDDADKPGADRGAGGGDLARHGYRDDVHRHRTARRL